MTGPPPPTGLVTLTTDFGRASAYVGSLKGALYAAASGLTLVDLCHDIAPFDIMEGALLLSAVAPTFPPGTVHLAVVDPGVGGPRRPLIVATERAFFVGPDNGLFTPVLDASAHVWEIDPSVAPGALSATFHGRDLFAPVAARLASGTAPASLGAPITDPVRLDWPRPRRDGEALVGVVLHVDGYGNVITSIPDSALPPGRAALRVEIAGHTILGVDRTYAQRPDGTLLALIGSSGLLEVAVARGHASLALGVRPGSPVRVVPAPAGGAP